MTLLGSLLSSARAATASLSITRTPGDKYNVPTVVAAVIYNAALSESSALLLSFEQHKYVLADSSALVVAQTGCQQVNPHEVACTEPSDVTMRNADITLGGGPDRFAFGTVEAASRLGAKITGGSQANQIDASRSSGPVTIIGGIGNDVLTGGPGNDRFIVGPGTHVIDGGPGTNIVDFQDAHGPVRASLVDGVATAPGEHDSLRRIQTLIGGPYDDVLVGDSGPNALYGAGGSNTLIGNGGADDLWAAGVSSLPALGPPPPAGTPRTTIVAGPGPARLHAACGADTLIGGPGGQTFDLDFSGPCKSIERRTPHDDTKVFCQSSIDVVESPNSFDVLNGCSRIRILTADGSILGRAPPSQLSARWLASYSIPCGDLRCRASLKLSVPRSGRSRLIVGRRQTQSRPNRTFRITATLSNQGRRYLGRHPNALVDVSLHLVSDFGGPSDYDYRVPVHPIAPPTVNAAVTADRLDSWRLTSTMESGVYSSAIGVG
jgi:hypothetical protein